MPKVMVKYRVKPELVEENKKLVEAVFAELAETKPVGIRYATFVADDGVTFWHVASIEGDGSPLTSSASFKAFQQGLKDRCDEPPRPMNVTEVASFNFFD